MQALDPNPFECQGAFCVTFHSFGSLLYMDIACALVLLVLAAVLYGRLRRRRDHNYFVIPLGEVSWRSSRPIRSGASIGRGRHTPQFCRRGRRARTKQMDLGAGGIHHCCSC